MGGLLHFEGNQAVLDENLPGAAAGTVDAVRRAHNLVVAPAVAVGVLPLAIFVGHDAMTIGEGALHLAEEFQAVKKMTHCLLLVVRYANLPRWLFPMMTLIKDS